MRKVFLVVFSVSVLLLMGCARSGSGGIIPIPNPVPDEYRVIVEVTPQEVYEGEEVSCFADITPGDYGGVITWEQIPSTPSGIFNPPTGETTKWKAPDVEMRTEFEIKASIVVGQTTYTGRATVVVLPKEAPPVYPPQIVIDYPFDKIVVGSETIMTILGKLKEGSNPIDRIEVEITDDNEVAILETFGNEVIEDIGGGIKCFRLDIKHFGAPGYKQVKVRVIDKQGVFGESTIEVINDDILLEEKALEFLRKYNCLFDGGTQRFGNLNTGPYHRPVRVYINTVEKWKSLIEQGCEFWTRYSGIEFELLVSEGEPEKPVVIISDETTQDLGNVVAMTYLYGLDDHETTTSVIKLYKGFLELSDPMKIGIIAHELGHVLLTSKEVTEFGCYFTMWPYGCPIDQQVIPPEVQKAIKLLYTHEPGWIPQ
ncbi:hypothetical protein H5T88_06640 [bacterium]|nr:hypothetical protein [bacterium]